MTNPWLEHVRAYRSKNPTKSYKQCLVDAKKTYKPKKGGSAFVAAVHKSKELSAYKQTIKDIRKKQSGGLFPLLPVLGLAIAKGVAAGAASAGTAYGVNKAING